MIAKLVLIAGNCPPLRKSELEYYAMLSKTTVHHFSGTNADALPMYTEFSPKDTPTVEVKTEVVETKIRKSVSPRKPKAIPQSLDVPHPAPPNWKEAYDTIKRMRQSIVAPVDTMGCDQAQFKETDPKVRCSLSWFITRVYSVRSFHVESQICYFDLAYVVLADEG